MTYSVKNSALTTTYTVNDNTENTTSTSLIFIGKNYTGYGLALNENFLYLLENFSNTAGMYPANPVPGQLFWDNTNKYMHVYDGAAWKVIYGPLNNLTVNTSISASTVSAGVIGNTGAQIYGANIAITGNAIIQNGLALNSNASLVTDQTTASLFNATATTLNIGGAATTVSIGAGTGRTTINNDAAADNFYATGGGQHVGYLTGAIGANTANSGAFTTVITSSNITAQTANVYAAYVVANTGLFGVIATNSQPYITSVGTLTGLVSSANITAQTANVYAAYVVANSGLSGTLITNAQTNITSVGTLTGLVSSANITAQTANMYAANHVANTATYSAAYYWANGVAFSSSTYSNTQVAGYLGAVAVSIVPSANASLNLGSTSSGYWNNVYAVNFLGTSTTAKYADLAEKYLPDTQYEIGTVMMVGGTAEVTQHNGDRIRAIGVTSAYPAYKMNSDLDGGVYVALKGRVPVRVIGPVKKGQSLFGTAHGLAMATNDTTPTTFAIALESFDGAGIGSVEAVIL
jgi:hypothetical protein